MQKVAFIINPHSAKGNYHHFLKNLSEKIEEPLYLVSKSISDTDIFMEKYWDQVDVFVAVGGDGTISNVAKKLIHTNKKLAIFPAGSGNGFSKETHFSADLESLLTKIKKGKSQSIDTFMVNDSFSINVAGLGFDGAVAEAFEKTSRGFLNYIKTSLKTFLGYAPIRIKFENNYALYDGNYLMMNIANSRQFGNNAFIAPHADMCDGLLEVALVRKFPFWHAPIFAYKMFTGGLKSNRYLQYLSVSEIQFTAKDAKWHLDGEYLEMSSEVQIKVLPQSLHILVS